MTEDQVVQAKIRADNDAYKQSFEAKAGYLENIVGRWWYTGDENKAGFQSVTNFTHDYEEGFKGSPNSADPSYWVDGSAARL